MFFAMVVWFVMTFIPALNGVSVVANILFVATGVIAIVIYAVSEGEVLEPFKYWLKSLKWSLPVVLALMLVPNEKTVWYMVGAYATQTLVTSETAQEFGSEGKALLIDLIKKAREEIAGGELPVSIPEAVEIVKKEVQ